MSIFFFGSSSFASQDLVNKLKKKPNTFFFSRKKKNLKNFIFFELRKKNEKIFKKFKFSQSDYIFFFSSYVPLKEALSNWENCRKINVIGLINFLKNIKKLPKKIILASSCSVYGNDNKFKDEKTFLKPETPYSLSKLAQENILRVFCKKNNIKFLCYRLGYVIGAKINNKRLVKKILIKSRKKKNIKLYKKNLNLNLIHTRDIGERIIKSYKSGEGIYNLTNKKKTSLINFYFALINKKKIYNCENNNYSPNKFFKRFPMIKQINFASSIKYFKNEN